MNREIESLTTGELF